MPQSNEAEVKLQEPAHQPKHEATIASWWYRKTYEPRLKPWFREKVFEKYAGLKGAEIDKCIYDTVRIESPIRGASSTTSQEFKKVEI